MLKVFREPVSALTHWGGMVQAVVLTVVLSAVAYQAGLSMLPFVIFGVSMSLMYLASACYHTFKVPEKALLWLRKLDHSAIFLMIAGSYTPIAVFALPEKWQLFTLIVVWSIAVVGITLKLLTMKLHRWVSTGLYLAMGWMGIVLLPELAKSLSVGALVCLGLGGLAYSLGAVVYGTKRFNPIPGVFGFHEIWHIFVLLGTLCHSIMMFFLMG